MPQSVRTLMGRRLLGPVWLLPVLVTLLTTLYRLGNPVMWQDELATISVVTRPAGKILATVQNVDAVHGLYYMAIHFWVTLAGDSPAALRLPSVLAMTAGAAFTALAAQRLFDYRAGLLAGLVYALVPAIGRYGQEARDYGMVVLASSLALLLLLRALERPTALRWLCYAGALALSGYSNLVSLAYLAGHAALVALALRREGGRARWIGFLGAGALAGLLLIPVVTLGEKQATRQISWIPKPTVRDLATLWPQILCSTGLVVALVAVVVLLGWRVRRRAELAVAVVMTLVPFVAVWALSYGSVSYVMPKYLFFLIPAVALLAGASLATLRLRYALPVALALAVVVIPDQRALHGTLSHNRYQYPTAAPFTALDYRAAADVVAAGYRAGDGIVYGYGYAQWWEIQTGVPYYLPSGDKPVDVFAGTTAEQRNDLWGITCPAPARCLGTEPRLWLVADGGHVVNPFTTVPKAEANVLRAHYHEVLRKLVSGLSVFLLTRVH
ncbi:glycosyltransferase family 39 protein [Streptacidiphilus fuscans]|uniref:Glycosyltransferase family 39 protein n=1 Tax=Streptacidiphilus fuscans TaxID=2789292 RepID=A0A931B6R0_9ACTN|nr:glycosyltransferase family 39 protein [Streptacidiphilus fuscans]MBF9067935.1 glycosyltransferase family 39 protein [Streptacidiphilus fuscans]